MQLLIVLSYSSSSFIRVVFYWALEITFAISFKARETNWAELTFAKTFGTVAGERKKNWLQRA